MAVASAGLYANHLHLTTDRQPQQHLITQFFTCWMLFLMPNKCQSIECNQSTEGIIPMKLFEIF